MASNVFLVLVNVVKVLLKFKREVKKARQHETGHRKCILSTRRKCKGPEAGRDMADREPSGGRGGRSEEAAEKGEQAPGPDETGLGKPPRPGTASPESSV